MALRKIVKIDEEKCDGCGICVPACAEGALQIIDGKARLVSEVYCDGLGACLGDCPQDAITIEEREADKFDEVAVEKYLESLNQTEQIQPIESPCGCPGAAMQTLKPDRAEQPNAPEQNIPSALQSWPVQLMLVPPMAPFLKSADILICADCVPFAVPDFHSRFLKGKIALVGCPKLDDISFYREKLKAIFAEARPSSVTVLRMEVPCCGGIVSAAVSAREEVIPDTPAEVHVIGINGSIQTQKLPDREPAADRTDG